MKLLITILTIILITYLSGVIVCYLLLLQEVKRTFKEYTYSNLTLYKKTLKRTLEFYIFSWWGVFIIVVKRML